MWSPAHAKEESVAIIELEDCTGGKQLCGKGPGILVASRTWCSSVPQQLKNPRVSWAVLIIGHIVNLWKWSWPTPQYLLVNIGNSEPCFRHLSTGKILINWNGFGRGLPGRSGDWLACILGSGCWTNLVQPGRGTSLGDLRSCKHPLSMEKSSRRQIQAIHGAVQGCKINREVLIRYKGKFFHHKDKSGKGRGCPGRLCCFRLWRFTRPDWIKP